MITTRKSLRLATLMTAGALLACSSDGTDDGTGPVGPDPASPRRIFTSLEIQSSAGSLVPVASLNTRRLEVRARDQDGRTLIGGAGSFTISSNNPAVASVGDEEFWTSSSNGVPVDSWVSAQVTAISTGEAVISASWTLGGVTKTARSTITVESLAGWSLKVTPAALTVPLGATERIQAWVLDRSGAPRISWSAFTPDRDGVVSLFEDDSCLYWVCHDINVRGVGVGEATLTARFHSLSAGIVVTVVPSA